MSSRLISSTGALLVLVAAIVVCCTVAATGAAAEGEGGAGGGEASEIAGTSLVRCVCRCCFHGDCSYVANASWMLDDCSTCSASRCHEMILSSATRTRISKTFRILQNLEQILTVEGEDRRVMLQHTLGALNDNKWNVCEVTAMVETVTCEASGTPGGCQTSADLSAICFDRSAPVVKYGTSFFLAIVTGGVIFAFIKNHLIGFQEFNAGAFDY